MIGAELLNQIDARLKQIIGNFDQNFGGLNIIFIGDCTQSVQLQSISSLNNKGFNPYN